MAQNDYVALENGVLPWLADAPVSHHNTQAKEQFGVMVQQGRRHGIKSPASAEMSSPAMVQAHQRAQSTRNQSTWASSGPGMQAIFLGPNKRSCGTGVFIPRGQGPEFQFSTKPAFSPVLLPSRVVQALNLNMHELGQHIKPQSEQNKDIVKKIDEKLEKNKKLEDDASFSPEIFLPEEWTY